MERTTVVADDELMAELRAIAQSEQTSLAEVIRQGLRLRVRQGRRPSFIGAVRTGSATAIADEADELDPQPRPWR